MRPRVCPVGRHTDAVACARRGTTRIDCDDVCASGRRTAPIRNWRLNQPDALLSSPYYCHYKVRCSTPPGLIIPTSDRPRTQSRSDPRALVMQLCRKFGVPAERVRCVSNFPSSECAHYAARRPLRNNALLNITRPELAQRRGSNPKNTQCTYTHAHTHGLN